jgi:hypothetical protein
MKNKKEGAKSCKGKEVVEEGGSKGKGMGKGNKVVRRHDRSVNFSDL